MNMVDIANPNDRCGTPPPAKDSAGVPVWNKPGHGVVAFIAEATLRSASPAAWKKIASVLESDPRGRDTVAKSARWPDDMRSDAAFIKRTGPWHFVDILWNEGDEPDANVALPDGPHAASKLTEIAAHMPNGDPESQADDLAFVLHLAGDLHQPLHCVTRVNDDHPAPEGDRGGNGFHLKGKVRNLHSLWDGLLVLGDGTSETKLKALAKEIAAELPQDGFDQAEIEEASADAWAREGYALAITEAYTGLDEGEAPSDEYLESARAVARKRAALGGYRLARLLQSIADQMP